MCNKCAEHRVADGQMMLDLPLSTTALTTRLDQGKIESAWRLSQDPMWMATFAKMLASPGADGISKPALEEYKLALAIQAKRFRYGPNGWEKSPEVPEDNQE